MRGMEWLFAKFYIFRPKKMTQIRNLLYRIKRLLFYIPRLIKNQRRNDFDHSLYDNQGKFIK